MAIRVIAPGEEPYFKFSATPAIIASAVLSAMDINKYMDDAARQMAIEIDKMVLDSFVGGVRYDQP